MRERRTRHHISGQTVKGGWRTEKDNLFIYSCSCGWKTQPARMTEAKAEWERHFLEAS